MCLIYNRGIMLVLFKEFFYFVFFRISQYLPNSVELLLQNNCTVILKDLKNKREKII